MTDETRPPEGYVVREETHRHTPEQLAEAAELSRRLDRRRDLKAEREALEDCFLRALRRRHPDLSFHVRRQQRG
jgi:hypothetical protein